MGMATFVVQSLKRSTCMHCIVKQVSLFYFRGKRKEKKRSFHPFFIFYYFCYSKGEIFSITRSNTIKQSILLVFGVNNVIFYNRHVKLIIFLILTSSTFNGEVLFYMKMISNVIIFMCFNSIFLPKYKIEPKPLIE